MMMRLLKPRTVAVAPWLLASNAAATDTTAIWLQGGPIEPAVANLGSF
jgi:hypothetical protein